MQIDVNSLYRHHSGRVYQVTGLTNTRFPSKPSFPLTVIYTDLSHSYSRPAIEFIENFVPYFPESLKPLHHCPLRHNRPPLPQDSWLLHANHDRVCSYCGSLHPKDFVRLIKEDSTLVLSRPHGYLHRLERPAVPSDKWGATSFILLHLMGIDETSLTI